MLGFFNDFLSGFRRFIFRLKEGPQINATEFIKSRLIHLILMLQLMF